VRRSPGGVCHAPMQQLAQPLMTGPSRDLDGARSAYQSGDVEASRAAHANAVRPAGMKATEDHIEAGGRIKSIVFGGLDGILTSFAVVSGAVGAHLGPVVILAMGISNVLADALSMGAGEYLSSRSYNNYVKKELEREAWELEHFPEGEVMEMIELYESRGMSREDATVVVTRMAKYKQFFLNIMMTEELCLPVPEPDDNINSLKDGMVMFASFAFFGMWPVLGFAVVPMFIPGLTEHELFLVACVITAIALFGLGAYKARFNEKFYIRSGVETVVLGGVCATIAFVVGRFVASFAGEVMEG